MGEVISLLERRQRNNTPVVTFEERLHTPQHEQAARFKYRFLMAAAAVMVGGVAAYIAYNPPGSRLAEAAKAVYSVAPLPAPGLR